MAVPAVSVPVLMTCKLPHVVNGHPAGWGNGAKGVPATNRFEPLSRPTVAPVIVPVTTFTVGVAGVAKFTLATLGAADPPHSVPQFKIKAVVSFVSLGSKTALKGWAPTGNVRTGATVLLAVSMTKNEFGLEPRCSGSSGNTSTLLPLGPITRRVALGTFTVVTRVPSDVLKISTTPEFRTDA